LNESYADFQRRDEDLHLGQGKTPDFTQALKPPINIAQIAG
jgi:hypothetical protein